MANNNANNAAPKGAATGAPNKGAPKGANAAPAAAPATGAAPAAPVLLQGRGTHTPTAGALHTTHGVVWVGVPWATRLCSKPGNLWPQVAGAGCAIGYGPNGSTVLHTATATVGSTTPQVQCYPGVPAGNGTMRPMWGLVLPAAAAQQLQAAAAAPNAHPALAWLAAAVLPV